MRRNKVRHLCKFSKDSVRCNVDSAHDIAKEVMALIITKFIQMRIQDKNSARMERIVGASVTPHGHQMLLVTIQRTFTQTLLRIISCHIWIHVSSLYLDPKLKSLWYFCIGIGSVFFSGNRLLNKHIREEKRQTFRTKL